MTGSRRVLVAGAGLAAGLTALIFVAPEFVAWSAVVRDPLASHGPVRADVVLCVGDGASWGVGVERADAWPWQLASRLASGRVERRAAPRLHTRDALRRLPQWLTETRPAVVVLSLGADDAAVEPTPWHERDRLRVDGRTPAPTRAEHDSRLVVGDWGAAANRVTIRADGTLRIGRRDGRWHAEADRLVVTTADASSTSPPTTLRWRRHGDVLELDGPVVGGSILLAPATREQPPLVRIAAALDAGRLLEAELRLDQLAALGTAEPTLRPAREALAAVAGAAAPVPALPASYHAAPTIPDATRAARAADLERAIARCVRSGARVIVVGHAGPLAAALDDDARAIAAAAGAPFVPLTDTATEPATGRSTPAGHAAIATRVAAAIDAARR